MIRPIETPRSSEELEVAITDAKVNLMTWLLTPSMIKTRADWEVVKDSLELLHISIKSVLDLGQTP